MEALEHIHVALVAIKIPDMKRGAHYINNLIGSIKKLGTPCVAFGIPSGDLEAPEVVNIAHDWIPVAIAEVIENRFPDPSTNVGYGDQRIGSER